MSGESRAEGWYADPAGRFELRWFDGAAWTPQVSQAGQTADDPFFRPEDFTPDALATRVVPGTGAPTGGGGGGRRVLLGILALIVIAGVVLAVVILGGGDDDVATEATTTTTTEVQETTTTTEVQETTTTTEPETTTTTEPVVQDPSEVVGANIGTAVGQLEDAGFVVTETETIDETVPDGQVVAAAEQPDGSVVLTVARAPVTRFLENVPTVQQDGMDVNGPTFDISGTTYSHGVKFFYCDEGDFVEYDLGRDFRRFQAIAGQLSTDDSAARVRLEISLDEQIVSTNDLSFAETLAIDLDVTGRLRLKIAITQLTSDACNTDFGLGDGRLLGVPSEVPEVQPG